jgi:hypothetical protein
MEHEPDYGGLAAIYQSIEIARLNDVLKQHGIEDWHVRHAICKDYFDGSGRFLDEGWFRYALWYGERQFVPRLTFAEKQQPSEHKSESEPVTYTAEEDETYFSNEYSDASTAGSLYWYFHNCDEELADVERGFDGDASE